MRQVLGLVLALGGAVLAGGTNRLSAEVAAPVEWQSGPAFQSMLEATQMGRVIDQLSTESLAASDKIAEDFGLSPSSGFAVQMQALFAPRGLEAIFLTALDREMQADGPALAAAATFFGSPAGQKATAAELEARKVIMDPKAEEAASSAYDRLAAENPARRVQIDAMLAAGDLVNFNVMGALNANLAFAEGMAEEGAMGDMSEADRLAMVWSQEGDLRESSGKWMTGFLTLAYAGLTEEELELYLTFARSPEGRRLNAAMFAAFDVLYRQTSREQGRIVGRLLQGSDI